MKQYDLIEEKVFKEVSKIHESLADILGLDLTFQLRKLGHYDVNEWENITKEDASLIIDIAKKIVSVAENE